MYSRDSATDRAVRERSSDSVPATPGKPSPLGSGVYWSGSTDAIFSSASLDLPPIFLPLLLLALSLPKMLRFEALERPLPVEALLALLAAWLRSSPLLSEVRTGSTSPTSTPASAWAVLRCLLISRCILSRRARSASLPRLPLISGGFCACASAKGRAPSGSGEVSTNDPSSGLS